MYPKHFAFSSSPGLAKAALSLSCAKGHSSCDASPNLWSSQEDEGAVTTSSNVTTCRRDAYSESLFRKSHLEELPRPFESFAANSQCQARTYESDNEKTIIKGLYGDNCIRMVGQTDLLQSSAKRKTTSPVSSKSSGIDSDESANSSHEIIVASSNAFFNDISNKDTKEIDLKDDTDCTICFTDMDK